MNIYSLLIVVSYACLLSACGGSGSAAIEDTGDKPRVLDMENYKLLDWQVAQSAKSAEHVILKMQGEVRHFGMDLTKTPPRGLPYRTKVTGAQVWIGDYPCTQGLNIQTDSMGYWELYVLKKKTTVKNVSIRYRKDFYSDAEERTILGQELPEEWRRAYASSNRFAITDTALDTLGFQFPDEIFLAYALGLLKNEVGEIQNLMVVTVGQTWASLFSDRLPHGMDNAKAVISPELATTPIYFNEQVMPDPSLKSTSVDGGVLFYNVPEGTYSVTAQKVGTEFDSVSFAVNNEVRCYIASPPFSVEAK